MNRSIVRDTVHREWEINTVLSELLICKGDDHGMGTIKGSKKKI
jgi:hypothetical protein